MRSGREKKIRAPSRAARQSFGQGLKVRDQTTAGCSGGMGRFFRLLADRFG
jgi:hypothetical protein